MISPFAYASHNQASSDEVELIRKSKEPRRTGEKSTHSQATCNDEENFVDLVVRDEQEQESEDNYNSREFKEQNSNFMLSEVELVRCKGEWGRLSRRSYWLRCKQEFQTPKLRFFHLLGLIFEEESAPSSFFINISRIVSSC